MSLAIELANDSRFQEQMGVNFRPQLGTVTAEDTANVKYTVRLFDDDATEVDAWSLNGASYGVHAVVYVLFLTPNPESAFILGAKGGLGTVGQKMGTLSLISLPTSSAGLSAGDLWNDSGTVKVV